MKRLFVGIPFPPQLQEKLKPFYQALKETGGDFRFVSLEILHLTLSFLGDVPKENIPKIVQALQSVLAAQKKVAIEFVGAGAFPDEQRINVVWVGVKDSVLVDLIKKVNQALSIETGHEEEVPHLTIARVKSGKNKDEIQNVLQKFKDTNFGSFVAEKVVLYESELTKEGPMYTIVREFLLV